MRTTHIGGLYLGLIFPTRISHLAHIGNNIHPTLNSYMGQIFRVWWVLIYPLWSHVAVSNNLRTMYVYHINRLYVTDVD
jgi:hypothetical protein